MQLRRVSLILPFLIAGLGFQASAQTAGNASAAKDAATPLLSPGAAYQEALRPLTITRASVANWSPTEQAALAVAIHQAAGACELRAVKDYTGDALVDLGHLCSMGQDFATSVAAITLYLKEDQEASPRLAEAYAIQVDADLRLKDEKAAFTAATEMLAKVPFAPAVEDATAEAINYMDLLFTADAEALAKARQPKLLGLMQSAGARPAAAGSADTSSPSLPELFEQALVLPELQQLAADASGARESVAAVEAAVPATATPDDAIAIEGWRQRYAQLGKPLGAIDAQRSLTLPAKMPQIPARRAITALLLFPDWCAQCIRLAQQIPKSVFSVEGNEAYMYGLLVETVPPEKKPSTKSKDAAAKDDQFNPADAAIYLNGTSTIVVAASLLQRFNAVDVPLLIVTDSDGIVRFISPADETALLPGNTVDSAVARIGAQRPVGGVPANPASSHAGKAATLR